MNRMITVFALAACAFAEPEADPQLAVYPYGIYGNAHATAGLVKHTASGAVVPDDTLSVKVAKAQHLAAKVNAYAYNAPVVGAYAPLTYAHTYAPYAYAPYTSLVRGKREADAEPEADAEADPQVFYNGFYNSGLYPYAHAYNYPAYTHVATAPVVAKTAVTAVKPAVVSAKYVAPATYTYAPYATHAYPYATYASPVAYTHAIAKRDAEADPEADAYYYSAYRNYGYPSYYSGYSRPYSYGYAPYYNRGYGYY